MMLLRLALMVQAVQSPFPELSRPGAGAEFARRIHQVCPAPASTAKDALLKQELQQAEVVRGSNVTADNWIALGCTRGLLMADGTLSHEGPEMVAGVSWAQGGQAALLQALKLRPADAHAADVLGILVLGETDPSLKQKVTAALVAATRAGVGSAGALRACADLSFRAGDYKTAKECATRALAAGKDSTWHLLELARLAFRDGDSLGGLNLFGRAGAVARDTASRLEIDWHLQWFLTPLEMESWRAIPDTGRGHWLRNQLVFRDVKDGQPMGARVAEHFKRLDYVEEHFLLRIPANVKEGLRTGPAVMEDGSNPGDPDPVLVTLGPDRDAAEVNARMWRDYARWQTDFDDRGVIWMRFGAPEKIQPYTCPKPRCVIVREAWVYRIDGETMVLDFEDEGFDGSAQATRLVTGVLGNYFCNGVDAKKCMLSGKANMGTLHLENIDEVRQEDRKTVAFATTNDDNSVRGDANLRMVSNLHRLWDPITGEPMSLVTWALRLDDLSIQESDSMRTAEVDLDLRRWDPSADQWSDTTISKHLIIPDRTAKRSHVTGFTVIPATAGVTSWSLVARQPDHRRGRAFDTGAPLSAGPLALSDLVLGVESEGLVWNNRGASIALAPLDAVDRTESVQLYYQVRSRIERPQLKTVISLYRTDGDRPSLEPALQVSYSDGVHEGLNEIAPLIDVSRLEHGSYRLEVRVEDEAARATAVRSTMLLLN